MIYYSKEKKELIIPSGFVAGNGPSEESYNEGYDDGYADGEAKGYTEGYSEGNTAGIETGKAEQKALVQSLTVTKDGTYTNENGYSPVVVNVPATNVKTLWATFYITFNEDTVLPLSLLNDVFLWAGLAYEYTVFDDGPFVTQSLYNIINSQTLIPAGTYLFLTSLLSTDGWHSHQLPSMRAFWWIGINNKIDATATEPDYHTYG